jgi:hypothetical protein
MNKNQHRAGLFKNPFVVRGLPREARQATHDKRIFEKPCLKEITLACRLLNTLE